ncbi:MAG TPA: hypothetical protein VFI70_13085 [Nitrososphaeraceae archaeon]|nr:hypothetical protein [Nitrososphaeraceae archaeon]
MSTKQKIMNVIAAHPKLATLGIGLAITLAIGTAITGMVDVQQAHAIQSNAGRAFG